MRLINCTNNQERITSAVEHGKKTSISRVAACHRLYVEECFPMACEQIANFSSSKSAARRSSNLPHRTGETLAGVEVFRHLPPDALHVLSARCRGTATMRSR